MEKVITTKKTIFDSSKLIKGQLILFKSINEEKYIPCILSDITEDSITICYHSKKTNKLKTENISLQTYLHELQNNFIFISDAELDYYTKAILNKDISDSVYIVTGYDNQDTDILGVYVDKDMAEKRQKNEQAKIEEDKDPDWYTSIHCNKHMIIK